MGEYHSSGNIDGDHGEYDLTRGHFICFDPYPDGFSPEDQARNAAKMFDKLHKEENFPFQLENLRAFTFQLNLYDVQSGMFNAITVLFELSSAGFLKGTKIEIFPFYLP